MRWVFVMKPSFLLRSGLWVIMLLCLPKAAMAVSSVVESPVYVPLVQADDGKWFIELSLGGGSSPAPFEFDTGGTGFYAAYSTNPSPSSWWGTNVTPTSTPAYNYYDSGETYTGNVVQTMVTFFGSSNNPLVGTPGNVTVGQITNISKNGLTNWDSSSVMTTNQRPPVQGNFYGDFGLSLNLNTNYSANPLENLIAQMTFTNGVTPGFVVNVQSNNPYLQIGLDSSQTHLSGATYFAMNADTNSVGKSFANTGLAYHSEQIFSTTLSLSNSADSSNVVLTNIGITPDTGAGVTIHNTAANTNFPTSWVVANGTTNVTNDQGVFTRTNYDPISGSLTLAGVGSNTIFDADSSAIQNNPPQLTTYPDFYLNAGKAIFEQNVIIYDLQNNQIGLLPQPVPEPSAPWLLLAGVAVVLHLAIRRKSAAGLRS